MLTKAILTAMAGLFNLKLPDGDCNKDAIEVWQGSTMNMALERAQAEKYITANNQSLDHLIQQHDN